MRVTAQSTGSLSITEIPSASGRAVRGAAGEEAVLPPEFQSDKVSVQKTFSVSLKPSAELRRGDELPTIAIDADAAPGEAPLVVLQHPSGAISFHPGAVSGRRGGKTAGNRYEFRIPLRRAHTIEGRRGLVAEIVKAVVLKVLQPMADKVVTFALPKLVRFWEETTWKKRGLAEGWFRVVPPPGAGALRLEPAVPEPGKRNLLFVHGTFSDAASSYGALTGTDFFRRAASLYADRMYAFNHFTVSKSPQENVDALLSTLPNDKCLFDVITHSRGGLVLRTIVERGADFGDKARRFQLGRAVLVASPNDGTPLATPDRWDKTVGWIANLLKIIERFTPENPLLTAAEFVSEAIVWLAHHASGDLPGLRSMDGGGETIEALQGPPAPPANAYSALVANFQPDESILNIMLDSGVDQFFGSANDLVVPSEGGWRVDRDGIRHVDAAAVGCFGGGGNIAPAEPSAVIHTSFFHRQETATFLIRGLNGEDQKLPPINLDAPLPDRRFVRGIAAAAAVAAPARVTATSREALAGAPRPRQYESFAMPTTAASNTFHVVIMEAPSATGARETPGHLDRIDRPALIYASYGGARVLEALNAGGASWKRIRDIHAQIKKATDEGTGVMPPMKDIALLGRLLFSVLFPGDVKRLYDTARSLQGTQRMDLVFTSMIPQIAEKPWEFAYDPGRRTFLATEEIHFVRNVRTLIPGDTSDPKAGPLRILIVSAQPAGTVELSTQQETDMIQRDFSALTDAGAAQIDILARATIADLHSKLSTAEFNVVHFIGHGIFDRETNEGYLAFQGPGGSLSRLDQRSARELFCGRGVKLLFLNACQTGSNSPADFNSGLAQDLVAHGLPALVANQYSVLDTAATSFAQFFYWGLARGLSFGAAAREARISVNYALSGPAVIDWAVPVLYARDPNSKLTLSTSPIPFIKPAAALAGQLRDAGDRSFRIAVWDVDRALPELDEVLTQLNNAQKGFEFLAASLSAPLDAFKVVGGKRYLWKERVARRLQGCAGELGANLLLCLTHYPLSDGGKKIFAWWPKDAQSIVIFSYAGMPLDPESRDTARALTNVIVRAIAATQKKLPLHPGPHKECPMYANEGAVMSIITARQAFDLECCAKFDDAKVLTALDAMLRVFDPPAEKETAARKAARKPSVRKR
jgi:hypothetical protein